MARKKIETTDTEVAVPTLSDDFTVDETVQQNQLRIELAKAALTGICANPTRSPLKDWPVEEIAKTALRLADAVITESKM